MKKNTKKVIKKSFRVPKVKEDKQQWLIWATHPMFKLFPIIGNVDEFKDWLIKEYKTELTNDILVGYKFLLYSAFSAAFDSLAGDKGLGIKGDLLLYTASADRIFINKLPNTCEGIVFLKNIYNEYAPIQKANDIEQLKAALQNFDSKVLSIFRKLFDTTVKVKKNRAYSDEELINFFLINKVFIFLSQLNNSGPVAYTGSLLKERRLKDSHFQLCFQGYKYALQFTFWKLMGDKAYKKSCIPDMQNTLTWYGMIYDENEELEKEKDDLIKAMQQTFTIEKQTSFDAFFYRISRDLIKPLEKKYKLDNARAEDLLIVNSKKYKKDIFKRLLTKSKITLETNLEEKMDMLLYWYPVELSTHHDNSVGAFIITLNGVVSLQNEKEKEFDRTIVCKFVHPREDGREGEDFSYGVLLDIKAASGHYSSEWVLFYDSCSNWSGMSSFLHGKAETAIKKFLKEKKIELREMKVGHSDFRKYMARYISDNPYHDIKIPVKEIEKQMEQTSILRRENTLLSDSQGLLFELISYYIVSKHEKYNKYTDRKWNINSESGQIDIILQNENELHIIECKLNPHTQNFKDEYKKLTNKLNTYNKPNRTSEFWFWHKPNEIAQQVLAENDIKHFSLQEIENEVPASIKAILNHKIN